MKKISISPFEIKNSLEELAQENPKVLNAGRGNPNFLHSEAREAFYLFSSFALSFFKTNKPKKDLAKAFRAFCSSKKGRSAAFLKKAFSYVEKNFSPEGFLSEMIEAALGNHYPTPPRIYPHIEKILLAYLEKVLSLSPSRYKLFATEGATGAMVYLFNSLKENRILKEKDRIAMITPIFSPYLEIPDLEEFSLEKIFLEQKGESLSDEELKKLEDPKVKILFLVNPGNPIARALNKKTLKKIAGLCKKRDLLIITDAVYAPFVKDFSCITSVLPKNTIAVYSYSKYFGVTGWRLGVILMKEEHKIDEWLAALPEEEKRKIDERYKTVSENPRSLKFIDRLEIDSRKPSLAHTGGLSGPQQLFMSFLSLAELLDEKKLYQKKLFALLKERAKYFYKGLEEPFVEAEGSTYYYCLLDLETLALKKYGSSFDRYLKKKKPLDFLFRLAREKGTVCLPGEGFHGPRWSLRVSLANLDAEECFEVGGNIRELLESIAE